MTRICIVIYMPLGSGYYKFRFVIEINHILTWGLFTTAVISFLWYMWMSVLHYTQLTSPKWRSLRRFFPVKQSHDFFPRFEMNTVIPLLSVILHSFLTMDNRVFFTISQYSQLTMLTRPQLHCECLSVASLPSFKLTSSSVIG